MIDVHSYRGTDCDVNHYLVIADFKLEWLAKSRQSRYSRGIHLISKTKILVCNLKQIIRSYGRNTKVQTRCLLPVRDMFIPVK